MHCWVYTAEVTAKRIRELYLKAVLRQDIAFFDKVGAGEITTRIQTDTRLWSLPFYLCTGVLTNVSCARFGPARFVRKGCPRGQLLLRICYWLCLGIREELATCSRYVFHPALHFYYWGRHEQIRVQVYAVRFNIRGRRPVVNAPNLRLSLKHIAEGGSLAEEVVSTIRTAQAFGTQSVLASLYNIPIRKAFDGDCRSAISQGIGLAGFFFAMYSAYALG